ncbi:MAG TPA: universal stress protein, partial [Magnetospirillum sp.]|nr:universal stress protein [Magnetospirillum sp.]
LSIIDHLSAHGITVTREVLAGEDIGIMDLLLSRAFDQGADLLVMGAHGGYHLPFFKGAGTRHILKHMTLPVLMSH